MVKQHCADLRSTSQSSIRTKPSLAERFPDCAVVLTASVQFVRFENGVAMILEAGSTLLSLESIYDKLNGVGVAMARVRSTSLVGCSVEGIKIRRICRWWEQVFHESMLFDERFGHLEEHDCHDLANGVYTPISWLIKRLVGRWVVSHVGRVWEFANAILAMCSPFTHGEVTDIGRSHPDHGGKD